MPELRSERTARALALSLWSSELEIGVRTLLILSISESLG